MPLSFFFFFFACTRTPRGVRLFASNPFECSAVQEFDVPRVFSPLSTLLSPSFLSFSVLRTCPEPYVTRSMPELLIISIYIDCVVSRSSEKQYQGPATLYGSSPIPFFFLHGPVIVSLSLSSSVDPATPG